MLHSALELDGSFGVTTVTKSWQEIMDRECEGSL